MGREIPFIYERTCAFPQITNFNSQFRSAGPNRLVNNLKDQSAHKHNKGLAKVSSKIVSGYSSVSIQGGSIRHFTTIANLAAA